MVKPGSKLIAWGNKFSSFDDIFNKLPGDIIHYIFRFLPSIKDVVKTSAISKSCLQAFGTFPINEFNLQDFFSSSSTREEEEEVKAKTEQFIKFVNSCIQRFGIQIRDGNCCYEHLSLRVHHQIRCLIPDGVLSAYWLKSLKLVGVRVYFSGSRVYLPSLTSILIQHSDIPNEQLQKLLSGCLALEDIALLDCDSLSKVDIFDNPNLETLHVSDRADPIAISLRAPKLKSFNYDSQDRTYNGDPVIEIHNSPELKRLSICGWERSDEWLHKFIAQFPLMEYLSIAWCNVLRNIEISNPLLKKIIITNCTSLVDVIISCNKLASFSLFTPDFNIPKPSIRMEMDNPPNNCTVGVSTVPISMVECDLLMEANWYCKLKEFLTRPFSFKSFTISVGAVSLDGDMNGEDVQKKLPPTACNIENLRLYVFAPFSCHSHILNGLLSACHPTIIKLDVVSQNNPNVISGIRSTVELVCKELCSRENKSKCWCKDDFKCWKHQLKDVKIKKIKGIKLKKDLDLYALLDMLPTLEDGNTIYFKLMW